MGAEEAQLNENAELLRNNLVQRDLQMKALIQDILNCRGSMDQLTSLNCMGRIKLKELRKDIDNLEEYSKENAHLKLGSEIELHRSQLSSTLQAFKNANVTSSFVIQTNMKEELFNDISSKVRQRKKNDKSSLVKMSSGVTDQLMSISRQLAETTQRSAETLDNLVSSSSSVHSTQDELHNTTGTISQSGKLLKKYGRREFTDKIVIMFAFLFFVVCVLYILNKRLF